MSEVVARLCKGCDQPLLPRGQRRKHPDDYRHARYCPRAPKSEHARWAEIDALEAKIEKEHGDGGIEPT